MWPQTRSILRTIRIGTSVRSQPGRVVMHTRGIGRVNSIVLKKGFYMRNGVFLMALSITCFAVTVRCLAASGDLDPQFGTGGRLMLQIAADEREYINAIAIQPDGKIIAGGEIGDFGADHNHALIVRLNPDGSLDPSFGTGGIMISANQIHLTDLVIQPDGKILTAATTSILGTTFDFAVVRYESDGSLDASFGSNGYAANGSGHAQDLILDADGSIVLLGYLPVFRNGSDYLAARFSSDGSIDNGFGIGGRVQTSFTSGMNSSDNAYAGAMQTDGKIVVTGAAGGFSPAMIRYMPDGTVDMTFGSNGTVFTPGFGAVTREMLIQADGKIVVAGGPFVVGRYNPDGTADQNFGSGGRVAGGFGAGNGNAQAITLAADGKLLVAGSVYFNGSGNSAFVLGRYDKNGSPDQKFGNGGFVITEFTGALDEARAVAVQSDGNIITAGYAAEPGASYHDLAFARFLAGSKRWTPSVISAGASRGSLDR